MGIDTLIVDDDELTVFLHQVFIQENGFNDRSKTFYNGQEPLDYLELNHEQSEEFCVLLDLNMPLISGWEFLDLLKEKVYQNKVKVVVLTSSVNESDKLKAKAFPQVVAFMEKPLTDDKVKFLKTLAPFKKYYEF